MQESEPYLRIFWPAEITDEPAYDLAKLPEGTEQDVLFPRLFSPLAGTEECASPS